MAANTPLLFNFSTNSVAPHHYRNADRTGPFPCPNFRMMYNVMYRSAIVIRKQIYLDHRHNDTVQKIARARGVSEAEVIREAIDAHGGRQIRKSALDPKAWARALKFMRSLKSRTGASRRKWNREELYEDRLKRYANRTR